MGGKPTSPTRTGASPPACQALDLTVVVLTRRRERELARALLSLTHQKGVTLKVLAIVDDCASSFAYLNNLPGSLGSIRYLRTHFAARKAADVSGPRRVARLRNMALGLVTSEWIAFLDDDNVVARQHYASLLECAAHLQAPAAHSWRSLWTHDARPYRLAGRHPWCQDRETAEALFAQYEGAGIYRSGSHIVRDQVVPRRRDLSMVDTSEWVFHTAFLRRYGFCERYTAEDWERARTEDSKLLDEIVAAGIIVPSTRRPTLRYFLGGYSNNASAEGAALAGWKR